MQNYGFYQFSLIAFIIFIVINLFAQNPFILDQFAEDPSARVFEDRVYVYPSHDILCSEGRGRIGWFCMEDYHVFSSANLTDWTDHGVIVSQNKVKWLIQHHTVCGLRTVFTETENIIFISLQKQKIQNMEEVFQ